MGAGMEPNAENKLFVGGCPTGSSEDDLRALFEKHGQVEEVFVMRGGSRSGMACAFVRFATQPMAQAAIDAIHGRITLPEAAEPLVVRWADAPGSRRREGREGGRKGRGGGGSRPGGGELQNGMEPGWVPPMMMSGQVYGGYPPMMMPNMGGPQAPMMPQSAMMQPAAMGGQFGANPFFGQGGVGPPGSYGNGGMLPPQHMAGPYAQQQMAQMVYMEQQGAMPPQFWQQQQMLQQQMQQPPSPTHAAAMHSPMLGPMNGAMMPPPLSPGGANGGAVPTGAQCGQRPMAAPPGAGGRM